MTTSGCDVSSRCFSSSTVLLIPFALSCRIFISLCLVFFCVCVSVQVWGRVEVCVVGMSLNCAPTRVCRVRPDPGMS